MKVIEQFIRSKSPNRPSEDGIVVTDHFLAVIDGSTSKALRQRSPSESNGLLAMLIVARCLSRQPADVTLSAFCRNVTNAIAQYYERQELPFLAEHPEERLCASCVVFSYRQRELWMIGDCQAMTGDGEKYDNPKRCEAENAEARAAFIQQELKRGATREDFMTNDRGRAFILKRIVDTMKGQNRQYSVIDGFPIAMHNVRQITIEPHISEIILASDGYPKLMPTLERSERALSRLLRDDPLCIGAFKATKGLMVGNNSFDDRAYLRASI